MKKKFIGDAFDHWKGSIIRHLGSEALLENLAVLPMITDDAPWSDSDVSLYSKLLNVIDKERILKSTEIFPGNRRYYFSSIRHSGDLFLDPDTGIATGMATPQHVKVADLELLADMDERRCRLLIVYQHASRDEFSARVKEVAEHVLYQIDQFHCTTYEGRQVAMLFFSYSRERIRDVNRVFLQFLGEQYAFRTRLFTWRIVWETGRP